MSYHFTIRIVFLFSHISLSSAFVPHFWSSRETPIHQCNEHRQSEQFHTDYAQRRSVLQTLIVALTTTTHPLTGQTAESQLAIPLESTGESLTVPLKWIPSLNAYVVYYSVGGERFGAVLDTGSPFLVVPSYCNRQKYGCYNPEQSLPSGLEPTFERFDNNQGQVEWRVAPFSFVNATGSMIGPSEMVFGVLSESLMDGPGGVFFGLIRDTDDWIRPSFLGQTNVKAMEIDLRDSTTPKSLTLHTKSPLHNTVEDYIPLVRDLNRKYGDPVIHYTAKASGLSANGNAVLRSNDQTPVHIIFDTGVTGMVVSRELFDQRYTAARLNKEKSLWGSVEVSFQTQQGQTVSLSAQKPVATPLGDKPWPKFKNAHLIVLGLAFLDGHKIVIDMDEQKLQIL